MKHGPLIVVGLLVAAASSWSAIILGPVIQWNDLQPFKDETTGALYPARRPGLAEQGLEVFRSQGCFHCHSQNVRSAGLASDLKQGLGARRTVALDFLYDSVVMPGEVRLGPDLANFGARARKGQGADTNALVSSVLSRLYNPQSKLPGSMMPRYPWLFEVRPKGSVADPLAIKPDNGVTLGAGEELVPKPEAVALAHYLLSLDSNVSIFEAPIPAPPKPNGATNEVANAGATTNVTSKP